MSWYRYIAEVAPPESRFTVVRTTSSNYAAKFSNLVLSEPSLVYIYSILTPTNRILFILVRGALLVLEEFSIVFGIIIGKQTNGQRGY